MTKKPLQYLTLTTVSITFYIKKSFLALKLVMEVARGPSKYNVWTCL